jgi:hypothetical protein
MEAINPWCPLSVYHEQVLGAPDVVMELLVDKLKLLDYEKDFCRRK